MAEPIDDQPATPELLAARTTAAAHQYALKNYAEAADLYSQASAIQDEVNGEMVPRNADLLYAYGRCLYKVAVSKSDVLGGKVAGPSGSGTDGGATDGKAPRGTKRKAHDDEAEAEAETATDSKSDKPYFQIEGDDEDWDEDDGEDADGAPAEEEEEDDLATAYEILDTARILFLRQLEELDQGDTQTAANGLTGTSSKRHIQDLLADTYDLQSEINLENERFPDSASDAKASLALKVALHPFESSIVAEAHFKVSLALEFAAKTTTERPDELTGEMHKEIEGVDEDLLRESAKHMEKAIESTKLRVKKEEKEMQECQDKEEKARLKKEVADVKEILADMEERLKDLRGVPSSLSIAALQDPDAPAAPGDAAARGLLTALLGDSPAEAKAKIAEATKNANDLTGLVRHKKRGKAETTNGASSTAAGANGAGKRKATEAADAGADKRAKVEDANGADELS